MSDRDRRTASLAGQGESAERHAHSEGLPEHHVSHQLEEQFEKLKSDLLQALRPAEPEQLELPLFGQLVFDWLAAIGPKRVVPDNEKRLARHLRPLFLEDEQTLSPAAVAQHIRALPVSPATRNKVRQVGRLTVQWAQAARRWTAPNPFELVRREREPKRVYETLSLEELAAVQRHLRADRRREFRISLHLGLRPGELFALRKSDVDFTAAAIRIHRSHSRDTTKTGTERLVPLLPAIAQDVFEAYHSTESELLFPGEDGKLQRHDTKMTRIIRTAMAKAGVGVLDVTYKCRRCKSVEVHPAPVRENVCTTCDVLRWPVPRVRAFRWYDLRHAAATLHRRAGADPLAIAVTLGHSVRQTTEAVYTHLSIDDLHRELSKWALERP